MQKSCKKVWKFQIFLLSLYCENDERDGDCYRRSLIRLENKYAEVTQLVERQPSKLKVAGSNPVFRSKQFLRMFTIYHLAGHYVRLNEYRILVGRDVEYLRCYIRKWAWG